VRSTESEERNVVRPCLGHAVWTNQRRQPDGDTLLNAIPQASHRARRAVTKVAPRKDQARSSPAPPCLGHIKPALRSEGEAAGVVQSTHYHGRHAGDRRHVGPGRTANAGRVVVSGPDRLIARGQCCG